MIHLMISKFCSSFSYQVTHAKLNLTKTEILAKPNICLRCDFNGGKKVISKNLNFNRKDDLMVRFFCSFKISQKVKKCPIDFNQPNMREKVEIIECGYQKAICGVTLNITLGKLINF